MFRLVGYHLSLANAIRDTSTRMGQATNQATLQDAVRAEVLLATDFTISFVKNSTDIFAEFPGSLIQPLRPQSELKLAHIESSTCRDSSHFLKYGDPHYHDGHADEYCHCCGHNTERLEAIIQMG